MYVGMKPLPRFKFARTFRGRVSKLFAKNSVVRGDPRRCFGSEFKLLLIDHAAKHEETAVFRSLRIAVERTSSCELIGVIE